MKIIAAFIYLLISINSHAQFFDKWKKDIDDLYGPGKMDRRMEICYESGLNRFGTSLEKIKEGSKKDAIEIINNINSNCIQWFQNVINKKPNENYPCISEVELIGKRVDTRCDDSYYLFEGNPNSPKIKKILTMDDAIRSLWTRNIDKEAVGFGSFVTRAEMARFAREHEDKRIQKEKEERELAIQREEANRRMAEANKRREEENKKKQEFLNSPEGKKQVALEKEAERNRQIQYAKEFPFYAEMTCSNGYSNFPLYACFAGRVETALELKNGSSYELLTMPKIMQLQSGPDESVVLDLKNSFKINMQNSREGMVLGLKIIRRSNNEITFEKKVTRFGVIAVQN